MKLRADLSDAKRMVVSSRLPIDRMVAKQRAKLERLDARIGALMSERVDEEEVLAELLAMAAGGRVMKGGE